MDFSYRPQCVCSSLNSILSQHWVINVRNQIGRRVVVIGLSALVFTLVVSLTAFAIEGEPFEEPTSLVIEEPAGDADEHLRLGIDFF